MKNQFLEEYLIYFKSELMLNSKLSHLSNSLIRSHSAITRKCSGLSEMAICVKVFCFRPNWALHNKIMVAGFIYNIFQKHQNVKILDISNIEPTPPSNIGRAANGVRLVNSQSFHLILNSETDLQYLIPQFFLYWCKSKIGHFTSQQILKIGNFWPIFHFQTQYFECDQNAVDASNLVKTCFLVFVLTWERLSFASQTHNSNLLDTHFPTIFNIQKCNKIVVFSDPTDASEKVDLLLFLWSARLVETYTKTSFIKNLLFLTLFSAPYSSGSATKTSISTTFFASSSKIEHF